VDGKVLLDLPYEEDVRAEVDMNVVATGSGRFVEIQGTGEECTFSREELEELTTLAVEGIAELTKLQAQVLTEGDPER
jgi:ribonuclease PH